MGDKTIVTIDPRAERLRALLADDVNACTDVGGRGPASLAPLTGIAEVMARHG